ncbi:MAG: hypothetical protein QNJ44_01280 [Rhodobacter sp.]|nr:hypothetical protein [Rhodobacter sp.]
MNAPVKHKQTEAILSPSRVALYIAAWEQKLGRRIDRATILPDGGIEVCIEGVGQQKNPADLVDMSE